MSSMKILSQYRAGRTVLRGVGGQGLYLLGGGEPDRKKAVVFEDEFRQPDNIPLWRRPGFLHGAWHRCLLRSAWSSRAHLVWAQPAGCTACKPMFVTRRATGASREQSIRSLHTHTHATDHEDAQSAKVCFGGSDKSNLSLLRCFRLRVDDACQNSSSRPSSVFFRRAHHARRRVPLQGFSGRTETKRTEQAPWRKKIHGRSRSSWAGRENLVPPRFAAVPCCCSRTYRPLLKRTPTGELRPAQIRLGVISRTLQALLYQLDQQIERFL